LSRGVCDAACSTFYSLNLWLDHRTCLLPAARAHTPLPCIPADIYPCPAGHRCRLPLPGSHPCTHPRTRGWSPSAVRAQCRPSSSPTHPPRELAHALRAACRTGWSDLDLPHYDIAVPAFAPSWTDQGDLQWTVGDSPLPAPCSRRGPVHRERHCGTCHSHPTPARGRLRRSCAPAVFTGTPRTHTRAAHLLRFPLPHHTPHLSTPPHHTRTFSHTFPTLHPHHACHTFNAHTHHALFTPTAVLTGSPSPAPFSVVRTHNSSSNWTVCGGSVSTYGWTLPFRRSEQVWSCRLSWTLRCRTPCDTRTAWLHRARGARHGATCAPLHCLHLPYTRCALRIISCCNCTHAPAVRLCLYALPPALVPCISVAATRADHSGHSATFITDFHGLVVGT